MIDPFHIAFARAVNEEMADQREKLSAGQAEKYSDYREAVGRMAGLNLALKIAERVEHERYGVPKTGTD